jgi:rhodanese-related sulfurtransferase
MEISEISVADLADDAVMLDVRQPDEFAAGHAIGAVNIPLDLLPVLLHDLPQTDGVLPVICKSGGRSARATAYLTQRGYQAVNVAGGTTAWAAAHKPMDSESGRPFVA